METYQTDFIRLAIEHHALGFGDFTLKSGRRSPYFFNAGKFHTGSAIAQLGRFYAAALVASGINFDMLFGPAYKGIPLATTTAAALADVYKIDVPYCYNRKEIKNHGERGGLVGAPILGRVVIIDDVITAGTAVREVLSIIEEQGAQAAAILVGLNRQEKGQGELSAIQELENITGIPVVSIIALDHIVQYLTADGSQEILDKIHEYRALYGV